MYGITRHHVIFQMALTSLDKVIVTSVAAIFLLWLCALVLLVVAYVGAREQRSPSIQQ